MGRLPAIVAGLSGILLVLGLLVVGAVAAVIVVPFAIVAVLVLRRRLRRRLAEMQAQAWPRQQADIEGVVIDVTVEPANQDADQPVPGRLRQGP